MIIDETTITRLNEYKGKGAVILIEEEMLEEIAVEDTEGYDFWAYSVHGWGEGHYFGDNVNIKVYMPIEI